MGRKVPKDLFVVTDDGRKYVMLCAVMHPLCALHDGIPLTFFGSKKRAYTTVDAAIEWCTQENIDRGGNDKGLKIKIEALEKFKAHVVEAGAADKE